MLSDSFCSAEFILSFHIAFLIYLFIFVSLLYLLKKGWQMKVEKAVSVKT